MIFIELNSWRCWSQKTRNHPSMTFEAPQGQWWASSSSTEYRCGILCEACILTGDLELSTRFWSILSDIQCRTSTMKAYQFRWELLPTLTSRSNPCRCKHKISKRLVHFLTGYTVLSLSSEMRWARNESPMILPEWRPLAVCDGEQ